MSALPEQYRQIKVLDASGKFVIPGTCDIHVHASQAPFQGIGQNIENGQWNTWFERYAFPDESRFNDPAYAELTYTRFAKSLLATPTTRLCAYATTSRDGDRDSHESSWQSSALQVTLGKVNMDRNSVQLDCWKQHEETIAQTRLWLEETKERYWCNLPDPHTALFPELYGKLFSSNWESLPRNTMSRCSRTFQRGWMKLTGCTSLHRILIIMRRPMTVLVCLDRIHRL